VIEEIHMANDNARDLLVRIDERTEQTQKDVNLLKHVILEGNGTPALTVQVATLNTRLSSMEENNKESSIPRHVTVGLIVSVIIACVGLVAGFVN